MGMTRRAFGRLAGVGAAGVLRGQERGRPNILLLFTDEQRHDTLGCGGNLAIRTPHLDRLAASGVRYVNGHTPSPICIAARMSSLSGLRSRGTGWTGNGRVAGTVAPMPVFPSMMDALREAGYRTHAIGKMHFSGRHFGLHQHETMEEAVDRRVDDAYLTELGRRGVRTRYPQGLRDLLYLQPQTSGIAVENAQSTWVADRSVAFLREHLKYRGRQPFFLWSSWIAPHPPFAPCEPYSGLYDPAKMALPVFRERELGTLASPAWGERARFDGAQLDDHRLRRLRALYYGQISHIDDGVGRILGELEKQGLAENTVVLFASDHGEMLGDHGLAHKSVPYEGSVRVPYLMRWPGRTQPGRVSQELVGLTDIFPTVLNGLGLRHPGGEGVLDGRSLFGAARDTYISEFGQGRTRWVMVRNARHKYVIWAAGGREELFDLIADPEERENLAEREKKLCANLRERVMDWERRRGLESSFEGGRFRVYSEPPVPKETPRNVVINEGRWPENLPDEEKGGVETYAEAFTRAVSRERTLAPEKLSIGLYKQRGGHSLAGTPWEEAWRKA